MDDRLALLSTLGKCIGAIVSNGAKAITEHIEKTNQEERETVKVKQEEGEDDSALSSESAKHILKLDREAKRRRLTTHYFTVC